jgi:uncharacterized protein (TIGR03437 family)
MLFRSALLFGVILRVAGGASPPLVDYVTYLGGSFADTAVGIAVDSTGAAYVAGNTASPDFPITSTSLGVPSATAGGAFITKFDPSGTAIDFSVRLGDSAATAFAVDASGNMYLGMGDQVVKLDPTAQNILYTTPIGGSVESMAVDEAGNIYIAGAGGPGLATTPGVYEGQSSAENCPSYSNGPGGPCNIAFITKLTPTGSVAWSTYLGGSGPDDAHAIAVDNAGNVWVAGETVSANFPTTANAISRTFHGEVDLGPLRYGDAFVAKLDPTGSHLLYSTYLGGSGADAAYGIAVDAAGAAYTAGGAGSPDFPTTPGALQTTYTNYNPNAPPGPGPDGFITKFDASGGLVYSTLTNSTIGPIVVDTAGQAYVSGGAGGPSLSVQAACPPTPTPAVSVINTAGSAVVETSPISGPYLALDGKGGLYSAGLTRTLVFFSTPHAFQTGYGGGDSDAFAAKVDFSQPAGPSLASVLNAGSLLPGYAGGYPTGAVAPGEIVTLFGNGFGATPTVSFGNTPAVITYSSNCQINAVVPFEYEVAVGGSFLVTVEAGDQTVGLIKLPIALVAPGIFTTNGRGSGQGAVLNQDSSVNSAANPAARGSVVSVYMTGVGGLNPYIQDGMLGPLRPPFPMVVAGVGATVGPEDATVKFAGQAPGLIAGATQVNVQIPQTTQVGAAVPMSITVADYASQQITIAVK